MTSSRTSQPRRSALPSVLVVLALGAGALGALPGSAVADTGVPASIPGSTASLLLPAAARDASFAHPATASTSNDVLASFSVDKPQSGGGTYLRVLGRRVGTADYRLKVRLLATGQVTGSLARSSAGTDTALQELTVPGVSPSGTLRTRLLVQGTGPTTLRAKVWSSTEAEPAAWQLTATDADPALQQAGRVGVSAYLSASATTAPETVAVNDLVVRAADVRLAGVPAGLTRSTSVQVGLGVDRPDVTLSCALDAAAATPCSTSMTYPALVDGAHRVRVGAKDAAGVVVGTAEGAWTVDSTAPDTTAALSPGSAGAATIALSATEAGTFSCSLDGAAWSACTGPVALSGLRPGTHTFAARAADQAGNVDASPATVSWTVADSSTPPGAGTTGVPAGTALTARYGDLTISTPGAVVDGLDLHGFLTITAPDVTVTRSIIRGAATATNRSLVQTTGARVRITDSTLLPASPSVYVDGLKGYGFTATRLDISRTVDTALVYGSDTTIQDSWLHDNVHYASDPAQGGGPSHDDGIQVQGGNNIAILRNTVPGAYNSAVQVTQDTAVTSNLTIAGNWLGGGGCTVNIAQKARGPIQGLTLTDNHFSRTSLYSGCAVIKDATTSVAATRNAYTDNGQAIALRNFS